MKKSNNQSYNRIVEYIQNNPMLNPIDKRNLMIYATQLYINGIENKENETIEDILEDLKKLNVKLKTSANTSIVSERLAREIQIVEQIGQYYKNGTNLEKISYELDKLYLESDMSVRKNSSLSYNLRKKEKQNESRRY